MGIEWEMVKKIKKKTQNKEGGDITRLEWGRTLWPYQFKRCWESARVHPMQKCIHTWVYLRYLKIVCFKRQQLLCTVSVFSLLNTFQVLHSSWTDPPPSPPTLRRNNEIWGSLWKGDVTFNKAVGEEVVLPQIKAGREGNLKNITLPGSVYKTATTL